MYYLDGLSSNIRSILTLASLEQERPRSIEELRVAYIKFCRNAIGDPFIPTDLDLQYCADSERIDRLVRKYLEKTEIDDLPYTIDPTPDSARVAARPAIQEGKKHLTNVNADLAELFDLVIHTMFYQRTSDSVGGSASSALGVIWFGHRKNWNTQDMAEFMLHELAHNLLFIDERVHGHYQSHEILSDDKTYAHSSVLQIKRPLDKAFHSLVVAHELLQFRARHLNVAEPSLHPKTNALRDSAMQTAQDIHAIVNQTDAVLPRFNDILSKITSNLEKLPFSCH